MSDLVSMNGVQSHTGGVYRDLKRIDVHAHYIPEFYREILVESGLGQPDGIGSLPPWDEKKALRAMDRFGVSTAILSISSPGVHFGDDSQARTLARRLNEEGTRLIEEYPNRFGLFASVPLPDVEGSIQEAIYALDELGADGVVVESNHRGMYLGDPLLDPLYQELDRRGTVVFVHPTSPPCHCSARLAQQYLQPMMEFIFETTRSICDMILSGVLERFPNLRVMVPHAGAALPVLTERIDLLLPLLGRSKGGPLKSMRETLRNLHFDLAGAPIPELLGALLQMADYNRIHYGSDYPFTPPDACLSLLHQIESTPLLNQDLRKRIFRDSALNLFPQLK
jgi:predicted TIM-barrel fold metal-dependent hydrolase